MSIWMLNTYICTHGLDYHAAPLILSHDTCRYTHMHISSSSSKSVSLHPFSLSLSLHCINAHIHAPALLIVCEHLHLAILFSQFSPQCINSHMYAPALLIACEHLGILSDSPWTLHTFTDVSDVSPHGICIEIRTCVAVCYSMWQCVAVCCSEKDRSRHLPS